MKKTTYTAEDKEEDDKRYLRMDAIEMAVQLRLSHNYPVADIGTFAQTIYEYISKDGIDKDDVEVGLRIHAANTAIRLLSSGGYEQGSFEKLAESIYKYIH